MPSQGDTGTLKDGTKVVFDGQGWSKAPAPSQGVASSLQSIFSGPGLEGAKQYGKELLTGEGSARKDVGKYGLEEIKGFGSALNPINIVKGLGNLALHPVDSVSGMVGQLGDAATGDPRALGGVLGSVVAPKLYGGALKSVNSGAQALADSPNLQRGAGYIGGAGAGIATGMHPFILARAGQMVGPLVGKGAQGVANASGSLMQLLRMTPREIAPVTDLERQFAGTIGNPKPPAPSVKLNTAPDVWQRVNQSANAPSGVEQYAPNTSGYTPTDVFGAEHGMAPGPGQVPYNTGAGPGELPSTVKIGGTNVPLSALPARLRAAILEQLTKGQ